MVAHQLDSLSPTAITNSLEILHDNTLVCPLVLLLFWLFKGPDALSLQRVGRSARPEPAVLVKAPRPNTESLNKTENRPGLADTRPTTVRTRILAPTTPTEGTARRHELTHGSGGTHRDRWTTSRACTGSGRVGWQSFFTVKTKKVRSAHALMKLYEQIHD